MTAYLIHLPGQPPLLLNRDHPERILGRAPGLDLTLADPTISRRHARLTWREGEAWIEDLGSRHGCTRNGQRLGAPARITAADQVSLGTVALRLERLSGAPGAGGEDLESTPLALPLENLGSWTQRGEGLDRLSDWRGALDLLQDVSLMMLQEMEPERMLGELLDRLYGFLDAGRGAVLFQGPTGTLVPLAVRGQDPASPGLPSLGPSAVEATLGRRMAVLFREPEGSPVAGGGRILASPTTSVMAVPVEHDGQVFGLFYFDAATGRGPFTEVDLRFVASLGNLAAAKLVQQRMAQELRGQRERDEELRTREESARARTTFLAQMSHEIRTPMNIVLGFTHLARGEALTPKVAGYLHKIEQSGRSMVRIVNDILEWSKLEAGAVVLEAVPFRLRETLAKVVDLFAPLAGPKGVGVELAVESPLPEVVLGDSLRLTQVLANLLGNAIKFTDQGKVRLEVSTSGATGALAPIRFAVQDTGPGIPPNQLEGLFSPYVQADPSVARRYGGTGLGLAIAKQLVACLGGELTVASELGKGSRFMFTLVLPLAPDGAIEAPQATEPLVPLPAGGRVLLVDDSAWNREWTQILLTREGLTAEGVSSGPEALARLGEAAFDAVLIDVEMPGMDGLETVKRIRAMGLTLPVIALSAHALPNYRAACMAAGMADYLAKPFEPKVLLETLGRWISAARREGTGEPLRQAGPPEATLASARLAHLAPVMDLPGALARLDGRADLLLGFLEKFLEDSLDPGAIAAAMAGRDPDQAARLAHDFRGIAASLGLTEVAQAAGALEARLRGWEPGAWQAPWERLKTALGAFQACAAIAFGHQ